MNNDTFGILLDQLLYISNQKKSTIAKELGYDISYISKWISGKNLPTSKNINKVCKSISNFIVKSLDTISYEDMINYFGLNIDECDKEFLSKYIFRELKESYIKTPTKRVHKIPKDTQLEMNYNSLASINTKLRKLYLENEMDIYMKENKDIDITIVADLFRLNNSEKISLSDMKKTIHNMKNNSNVRVKFITSFMGKSKNIIMDSILIINMISTHPEVNLEIYNCEITSDAQFFIIKDRIINSSIFTKDGKCIFSTLSKEKKTIDELYYSIEDSLKLQGKPIYERKMSTSIIKNNIYAQYILGNDLKWLIGSMNELFMPEELFIEISESIFGENKDIMDELRKINIFLNNKTYKSKLKVLIYENELRRYISSGELRFFNTPVKLSFKQIEKHIEYMVKILKENPYLNIKLIEGDFINEFKDKLNPSMYLSKNVKLTTINSNNFINEYAVIADNQFKSICNNMFEEMWDNRNDVTLDNKEEIIENIIEFLSYTKIVNENFKKSMKQ
ncbi:hypothetical protein EAI30_15615 [Romboutsia ilealis]|uniref:HTH cro/C1-type domain-containing protein n=1 Tax=Romboutsia faecis TaxID=2764597 RepID=A0ABR7JJR6_9FIRM|nr:hypothetical protein [Romboutsia faecis]MBC5995149.1 hypothetical protein [Romboutsia faecis]MRN26046.1 hypothetical protein [Romboutsia ilealis]